MGLDSVELIMDVEKHFSISIPDRDAEKAHTVGKLVDCVGGILGVNKYNFAFREKTFDNIKKALLELDNSIADFPIISVVSRSLNTADKPLLRQLEEKTGLKFPGINTNAYEGNSIFLKLGKWFKSIETIEFTEITWKKYIDILLAVNLEKLHPPILYYSKYEIYIAIMRITVDKIGVMYEEIGIEKSFTDDLGIDQAVAYVYYILKNKNDYWSAQRMNLLGIIFSLLFLWMLFVTFKRWYRLNKSWLVFPFRNKNKVAPSDSEVRQYVLFVLVRFVAFVVLFVIGLLLAKQFPVLYKELF